MAISLPANVTAFLTQVKNDLTVGHALDGPTSPILFAPGRNFCSAQDIANVLRLLAAATGNSALLSAEISAIMKGKDPATQQFIGTVGGNNMLIVDAFKKLIEYCGATFPGGKSMLSTTAIAGTSTTQIAVNLRGGKLRIDELRGYMLTVAGVRSQIMSNTADGVFTIASPITAPSGGETVTVNHAFDVFGIGSEPKVRAGGQPGDNARLAFLIQAAQDAVVAYTVSSLTVSAMSGSAHVAGAAATFTVVFAGQAPLSNVVVPVVSSNTGNATVSPATLTFTPGNYTTPQTVTVTAVAVGSTPVNVGPATGDVHFAGLSGSVTAVTVSP